MLSAIWTNFSLTALGSSRSAALRFLRVLWWAERCMMTKSREVTSREFPILLPLYKRSYTPTPWSRFNVVSAHFTEGA